MIVVLKSESILGVTDCNALEEQLAEHALGAETVRTAEDLFGFPSFVAASLNQTIAAEQGEAGA